MNRLHVNNRKRLLASAAILTLASAAAFIAVAAPGCSRREVGQVNGTLKLKKDDIRLASKGNEKWVVHFVDNRNNNYSGDVKPDGTFTVENVPVGRVRIAVVRFIDNGPPLPPPGSQRNSMSKHAPMFSEVDEAKYRDPNLSGLTFTVGRGVQHHDITLE